MAKAPRAHPQSSRGLNLALLLDTCILVDLLRGNGAAQRMLAAVPERPVICAVSDMELLAGARSQRDEDRIEKLLGLFRRVAVDLPVFRLAGTYIRHYRASHALDIPDALIAATAEHHGLALATLNVKHFPMLDGLKRAY